MIQILRDPPAFAYAFNPIDYEIKTLESNGVPYRLRYASASIVFSLLNFQEGDAILVKITDEHAYDTQIGFFAKNTPVSLTDFGTSFSLEQIATIIQGHYFISPFVKIYVENNAIIIESKFLGCTIDAVIDSSTTTANVVLTTDEGINTPSGYRLTHNVIFEKLYSQGLYNIVNESEMYPNDDGSNLVISIGSVLSSETKNSRMLYPFSFYSRTEARLSDNIRRYYTRLREFDDTGLLSTVVTPIRYLLAGGVHSSILADNTISYNKDNCYLTHQPDNKHIQAAGIEFLSWINYTGGNHNVVPSVRLFGDNGLIDSYIVESLTINVPAGRSVTFPLSAESLDINNPLVKYFSIRIRSADTSDIFSNFRTYIFKRPQRFFQLGYINGFGVPETITCEGNLTQSTKIASNRWATSDKNKNTVTREAIDFQVNYTYRSGYLSSKWKEAFAEVALSYVLYDVTTPQYLALRITDERSKEDILYSVEENLYNWEWKIELAENDLNFANNDTLRATPVQGGANISIQGGNIVSSGSGSDQFVKYKQVATLTILSNIQSSATLTYPTIYYCANGDGTFFAAGPADLFQIGASFASLSIEQFPFEIDVNNNSFTCGFNISDSDDNVLIFLGGTLRNKGIGKDYTIQSGSIIQFEWMPTEPISGVILKITL